MNLDSIFSFFGLLPSLFSFLRIDWWSEEWDQLTTIKCRKETWKRTWFTLFITPTSPWFLLHASEENLLQQWCHWRRKCSVYSREHPVVLLKTRRKPNKKKRSYKQNNKPHLKLRRAPLRRLYYTLFTLLSTYISLSLSNNMWTLI